MKYWELISDNLHDAEWSLGWVSALDVEGPPIWIVDAHGYGKHFIVRADDADCFRRTAAGDTRTRREFDLVTARAETWEMSLLRKSAAGPGLVT